jgi:hypothetical protein
MRGHVYYAELLKRLIYPRAEGSVLFAEISCEQHDKVIKYIYNVGPITSRQVTSNDWIFQKKIP